MRNLSRCIRISAFLVIAIGILTTTAFGWSSAHYRVSTAAYDALPQELADLWSQPHTDPYYVDPTPRTIDYFLTSYAWYTGNPDHHDGPNPSDYNRKRYISNFIYAELNGEYVMAVPYNDPDHVGPRPKTFHYLPYDEAGNRAFTIRAAEWVFAQTVQAFMESNPADAAQFMGTFAHAIEDRSSVYHAWDGYSALREQFETDNNIQGSTPGVSDFWRISDVAVRVDLTGYTPVLLGATIEEAAEVFADRLQASADFTRNLNMTTFFDAHINDDWENKVSGAAATAIMDDMAEFGAFLVADAFYTSYVLYEMQVPLPPTALLLLCGVVGCAFLKSARR